MIKHKEIYASIYIRSIIDLDQEETYYKRSIRTNLAMVELKFAEQNRATYDSIVKQTLEVWKIVKEGKTHFMIQSIPLIGALYHEVKKDLNLPKILFNRLSETYHAAGDDMYEVKSFKLAAEIYKVTQEVVDGKH